MAPVLPTRTVEIAFATDPAAAPTWVDVSQWVRHVGTQRGRQAETDRFQAGTATVVFDNRTRRFDPTYTAGAYYPNVVPMRRMRIRATWAAIPYYLFDGYVDGWNQVYDQPREARVELAATDGFKVLAAAQLPGSTYGAEVLADSPAALWPFGEASGAPYALDVISGRTLTYNGTPTLGAASLVARDPGAAVSFPVDGGAQMSATPVTGGPFTIEGIYQWTSSNNDTQFGYTTFDSPATSAYGIDILGFDGSLDFAVATPTASNTVLSTGVNVKDGAVHHIVGVWKANGDLKIYVDGVDRTASVVNVPIGTFKTTGVFLVNAGSRAGAALNGTVSTWDEVALYNTELSAARIAAHAAARSGAWNGDLSGARVTRLLDLAAWSATQRSVDTGSSTLQGSSLGGVTLAALQAVEATETGRLFITGDGKVRFQGRAATFNTVSVATFGDGAGDLRYADLTYDYSDTRIRNDILATRDGGVTQRAQDTASQTRYLRRSYPISGLLHQTDLASIDVANYLLGKYKDPLLRVTNLTIAPQRDPTNLFPQVLGREIGDRITVKRLPQGVGASINQDVIIEGVSHTFDAESWQTTWTLSPADTDLYLQLDATSGPGLGFAKLAF